MSLRSVLSGFCTRTPFTLAWPRNTRFPGSQKQLVLQPEAQRKSRLEVGKQEKREGQGEQLAVLYGQSAMTAHSQLTPLVRYGWGTESMAAPFFWGPQHQEWGQWHQEHMTACLCGGGHSDNSLKASWTLAGNAGWRLANASVDLGHFTDQAREWGLRERQECPPPAACAEVPSNEWPV